MVLPPEVSERPLVDTKEFKLSIKIPRIIEVMISPSKVHMIAKHLPGIVLGAMSP